MSPLRSASHVPLHLAPTAVPLGEIRQEPVRVARPLRNRLVWAGIEGPTACPPRAGRGTVTA
jgi:hypothetical protein